MVGKNLLSLTDARNRLGISRVTLYRYIKSGAIPAIQVGRLIKIDPDELDKYLSKSRVGGNVAVLPKICSWSNIDDLVYCLHEVEKAPGSLITIDFGNTEFFTPAGIAVCCSAINNLISRGKKINFIVSKNNDVNTYLNGIGFWGCLNLPATDTPTTLAQPSIQLRRLRSLDLKLTNEIVNFFSGSINLSAGVRGVLALAHNELIDNVFVHSQTRDGALVCAQGTPTAKLLKLAVLDEGQGIRASLLVRYPKLSNDIDAIKLSMKKGIGAKADEDRGLGLYHLHKLVLLNGGELRVMCGRAKVVFSSAGISEAATKNYWQGAVIEVKLRMDKEHSYSLASEDTF